MAALHRVSGGFEHWTFDSLRQARASEGALSVPATTLRDSVGETFTLWHAESGTSPAPIYIVDFIYTTCPTVCQALGSEYQQMQHRLHAEPDHSVRLLSISFDLRRDHRDALAGYARRFAADRSRWQVAAPIDDASSQALRRQLGVVAVPDGMGGFVHNAALHLIDGRGHVHAIYEPADWLQALAHARRIALAQQP